MPFLFEHDINKCFHNDIHFCGVYRVVHKVKQPVTRPGTNRDLRCLTSLKSQPGFNSKAVEVVYIPISVTFLPLFS